MRLLILFPETEHSVQIVKFPPYGIACIAAYLKENNPYISLEVKGCRNKDVLSLMETLEFSKYDIIAIGFTTPNSAWVYEKTKLIKQAYSDLICLHGGIHPTIDPFSSLESGADIVVRGEGEETLSELLEMVHLHRKDYFQYLDNIQGIHFLRAGQMISTPQRPLIKDLDKIPLPDWTIFNLDIYNGKDFTLPLMGARGCNFSCNFCCSPIIWRQHIRYRSPEIVVNEMQYNIDNFKFFKYRFLDDDFLANPKFARDVCQLILERDLNIEFVIFARCDSVNRNKDILELMSKAGLREVEIGVENASSEVLTNMNKKITFDDTELAVSLLKKYNIKIFYLLIFAYPGETLESICITNQYINRLKDTNNELIYGQYLVPYPGTKLAETCEEDGILIERNYSNYISTDIVYLPFSILDQKPFAICKPNKQQLDAMCASYINASRTLGIRKVKEYIEMICNLSDGTRSVQDIIYSFINNFKLNSKFAHKFVYRFINYLAQFNCIQNSADSV